MILSEHQTTWGGRGGERHYITIQIVLPQKAMYAFMPHVGQLVGDGLRPSAVLQACLEHIEAID